MASITTDREFFDHLPFGSTGGTIYIGESDRKPNALVDLSGLIELPDHEATPDNPMQAWWIGGIDPDRNVEMIQLSCDLSLDFDPVLETGDRKNVMPIFRVSSCELGKTALEAGGWSNDPLRSGERGGVYGHVTVNGRGAAKMAWNVGLKGGAMGQVVKPLRPLLATPNIALSWVCDDVGSRLSGVGAQVMKSPEVSNAFPQRRTRNQLWYVDFGSKPGGPEIVPTLNGRWSNIRFKVTYADAEQPAPGPQPGPGPTPEPQLVELVSEGYVGQEPVAIEWKVLRVHTPNLSNPSYVLVTPAGTCRLD